MSARYQRRAAQYQSDPGEWGTYFTTPNYLFKEKKKLVLRGNNNNNNNKSNRINNECVANESLMEESQRT